MHATAALALSAALALTSTALDAQVGLVHRISIHNPGFAPNSLGSSLRGVAAIIDHGVQKAILKNPLSNVTRGAGRSVTGLWTSEGHFSKRAASALARHAIVVHYGLFNGGPAFHDEHYRFAVVNDFRFASAWTRFFDPRLTKVGAFHGVHGVQRAQLMTSYQRGSYETARGLHRLILPLNDGSAEFAWSDDVKRVDEASQLLGNPTRINIVGPIEVVIPRLKSSRLVSFKDALRRDGLGDLFDSRKNIFAPAGNGFPAALDDVLQSSDFLMDEVGVKIHATTIAGTELGIIKPREAVRVNRAFWLRISKGAQTLFIARYDDL